MLREERELAVGSWQLAVGSWQLAVGSRQWKIEVLGKKVLREEREGGKQWAVSREDEC